MLHELPTEYGINGPESEMTCCILYAYQLYLQRILPTNEIAKVPRHSFLAKVNRPGLSPFPRRQIPPSSKLDVELGVAESKMVNIKQIMLLPQTNFRSWYTFSYKTNWGFFSSCLLNEFKKGSLKTRRSRRRGHRRWPRPPSPLPHATEGYFILSYASIKSQR